MTVEDGAPSGPRPRAESALFARIPTLTGVAVLALGALALLGWLTGSRFLKGVAPGLPTMKATTAIGLMLAGAALICLRAGGSPRAHAAGRTLGLAIAALGLIVCAEYVFGNLGIDRLLFSDPTSTYPGRPSPHTAISFVVLGLAIATVDGRGSWRRANVALILALCAVVLVLVVGWIYDVNYLRGISGKTGVAANTLLSLALVLAGLLCLRPARPPLALMRGERAGARVARTLIPIAVLVPLLLGALWLGGSSHGLLGSHVGVFAYTLSMIAVLAVVAWITARALDRAEAEVRAQAEIVDASDEAIIRKRTDGTMVSWNRGAERMYGYPAAEVVGRHVSVLSPPDRRAEIERLLAAVRRGEVTRLETQRVRRDGTVLDVALTVSPIRDGAGVVLGAATVAHDITARKRAEQEARRLATVVRSSADAIISLDRDRRIASFNPGAEALLGYAMQDICGRPVSALVPTERMGELDQYMSRVWRGEPVTGWETERRRSDGELVEVELSVSPITDADGAIVGATAVLRDTRERREAERRFASLLEAAPDPIVIADAGGRIVLANRKAEEVFGYGRETLIGTAIELLVPESLRAAHVVHRADYERDPRARPMGGHLVLAARHRDGHEIPVEISLSPVETESGRLVIAGIRDVTARRRAEQALATSEERFRRSFEDSGVGMALAAVQDGRLSRLMEVNPALTSITGYSREQLSAAGPLSIVHPDDLPQLRSDLGALLDGSLGVVRLELRLLSSSGDTVWTAITISLVRDGAGRALHAVLQAQDVSERKRFEGQLQYLADHDALTGLFNRRRFEEELKREIASARRYGTCGAVIVLDLDHFKLVNDTFGHATGDELITITGQVLRRRLRETDILGRLGGDEFAVLIPRADERHARRIAETLREEIRQDTEAAGASGTRRVTASLGVATFGGSSPELAAEELLAEADIAMYDAKEAGRDRVAVYDVHAARHERMQARLNWSERIEEALASDRFVLHAQPIVAVDGHPDTRFELLLRMIDDDGDLIPPGTFLYVAERSDLAQEIDRWVVRKAVAELVALRRAGREVTFEINLSGGSVTDGGMLEFISGEIARSGIDPGHLIFEVTETAAIVNVARAEAFAGRLRGLGCGFAIDDFGAGFASFYYLKHLSFDFLKIDGEFIQGLSDSRTNQLVVRSVVDIARGLGKQTIAEFVGDEATMQLLREYGVDYAQGYHVGRPRPLSEYFEGPPTQRTGSTGPEPLRRIS